MSSIGRRALTWAWVVSLLAASAASGGVLAQESTPDPGAGRAPGPGTVATGEPGHGPLAEREVFGFLPYWESADIASDDLQTLTTLAFFGVEAGPDGRLVRTDREGEPTPGWAGWTSEAFLGLRDRAEAAGVRVVLTVTRFAWDAPGRRRTKALLGDPAARATLVTEIVDTLSSAGAGGVNLDVEPLPRSVRAGFVRLVRELRAAMDAVDPSWQLTYDLTPDVSRFPVARLARAGAAHAAVLMGYEYRSAATRVAGSVSPLRDPDGLDLRDSLSRALADAPAGQLILALPWYGRAWSTRDDSVGSRTRRDDRFIAPATALYRTAVERAAIAGRRFDRAQASAWSVYGSRACPTCPFSWRQLWYDDVDSMRAKVGLARRRDLRGVGIWALGYEGQRPELWSALRHALGPSADRSPPAGSARIATESTLGDEDGRPVVGPIVTLELDAADGAGESGLAFARLSTRRRVDEDGLLARGTTFPAVERLTLELPDGLPPDDPFIPGGTTSAPTAVDAAASPASGADASATPAAADVLPPTVLDPPVVELQPVTIRVQWRDVAGNWSEPLAIPVWYRPEPVEEADPGA